MHIILGALATIVTILVLLNRLSDNGIDIGWLNPFAWKRRREWAKKYHADPIYSIQGPLEVTALIIVGLAKCDGDISAEQKAEIMNKFSEVFHLDGDAASSLFTASTFLLKDDPEAISHMSKLLNPSIDRFTKEQAVSALELMTHIANFDAPANRFQKQAIDAFQAQFSQRFNLSADWT